MDPGADELNLEGITQLHGIATATFIPYAIERLRASGRPTEAMLQVTLRDLDSEGDEERTLRLTWPADSVPQQPLGVQAHTVTERGAVAVACAIVWLYAGLRIRAVAIPGESFDFWLTNGEEHFGLEVSGTMTNDLEARHREKVRQLRDNPYGVDGYVVAVDFSRRAAIFSFDRFEEANA